MKCRNCKNNGFLTDENGTQYSWCEVACDNLDVDEERRCAAFVKATNADRIRAMTDEELAFQLYLLRLDALRLEGYEGFIETKDEVLDWLKEEVEDGVDS